MGVIGVRLSTLLIELIKLKWNFLILNMKLLNPLKIPGYFGLIIFVVSLAISCKSNNTQLTADENAAVKDRVNSMVAHIAKDVSAKGPIAWLDYFENDPGFFMANDGQLALKDYPTAITFVKNTLVNMMPRISLQWRNVKIDPLNPSLAAIGAEFHEDIVLSGGKTLAADGYFTGTAHFDGKSWKLRNLHWSSKPSLKPAA